MALNLFPRIGVSRESGALAKTSPRGAEAISRVLAVKSHAEVWQYQNEVKSREAKRAKRYQPTDSEPVWPG